MKTGPDSWHTHLTSEWLPFPEELLQRLGWVEGDEISIEAAGDCLVLQKVGEAERRVIVREAPSKRREIR